MAMSGLTTLREYIEDQLAARGRHPFCGSIELTASCNLSCRHCYMTPYRRVPELSTEEVLRILDMLVEAGCLSLLITGGEPLLRPDFHEIWRAAKERGFVLTLYTNGILVDDAVVDLLGELPPMLCEVSLYGASNATYASLCGLADGFDRATAGVERLLGVCPHIGIKSMMLPQNADDMVLLQAWCDARDLPFHFDTDVFPRLNGDLMPLELAFSPEEGVRRVMGNALHNKVWSEELAKSHEGHALKRLLACRAGESSFHIGPYGDLCLCMLVREPFYDLRTGDFLTGWTTVLETLRCCERKGVTACDGCEVLGLCVPCIGRNFLETGNMETPAPSLCKRSRAIFEMMQGKNSSS